MFFGKPEDKILTWRNFRNELTDWPEGIDKVSKLWANAPFTNNYLTYENPKKWPDAWTLVGDGIYCNISIALGMFYTLYYSSYQHKDTMTLEYYHLRDRQEILNLVNLEDGKYMLNYHHGRSVNILTIEALPRPTLILTAKDLPIKN